MRRVRRESAERECVLRGEVGCDAAGDKSGFGSGERRGEGGSSCYVTKKHLPFTYDHHARRMQKQMWKLELKKVLKNKTIPQNVQLK